ncbi:hypothetical protein DLJ59_00325 [Micromonospora inaquosa]|uniref:Uncharacterized protein n=1 Tax=Micromonospora inaquosa TaxID=2203716 RepID=A0A3N9XSW9_9ACTN|nr:hypothetical protein DLJ59_00325 [Micromonospora inaquosa]
MGNLSGGGANAPAETDGSDAVTRRRRAPEGTPAAVLAVTATGTAWYGRRRGKVRPQGRA